MAIKSHDYCYCQDVSHAHMHGHNVTGNQHTPNKYTKPHALSFCTCVDPPHQPQTGQRKRLLTLCLGGYTSAREWERENK